MEDGLDEIKEKIDASEKYIRKLKLLLSNENNTLERFKDEFKKKKHELFILEILNNEKIKSINFSEDEKLIVANAVRYSGVFYESDLDKIIENVESYKNNNLCILKDIKRLYNYNGYYWCDSSYKYKINHCCYEYYFEYENGIITKVMI